MRKCGQETSFVPGTDYSPVSRTRRSFSSACPRGSCVHVEGFQQGRQMPSKIDFESEDQVMNEVVDTAADVKIPKVRRVNVVAGN